MSSIEKYSDRIADYLFNDMSLLERKQFEEDLLTDNELAEEYKRQDHMIDYLKSRSALEEMTSDSADMAEARRVVENFYNSEEGQGQDNRSLQSKGRKVSRLLYPLIGIAAIFAGFMIYKISFLDDFNERLYKRNYAPLESSNLVYRGEPKQFDLMLQEGLSLYLEGAYLESNSILMELIQEDPDNPQVGLYYALSRMALEDYEQAAKLFESHVSNQDQFVTEATWYLGLCYIKINSPEKARPYFEDLSKIGGFYGKKSSEILERLDR